MDDLDPRDEVAEPTDAWVADLVRRCRGLPPGEPISPLLIAAVRRELRRIARRRIVARREHGEPLSATAGDIGGDARQSVREVLLEMISSPYAHAGIYMLLAMPLVMNAAASGVVRVVRQSSRHESAPARAYLAGKIGGTPWSSRWGARRPFMFGTDGRRLPARSMTELGPHPFHLAACNAVTPSRARDWLNRLTDCSDADRRLVLTEMRQVGEAASLSHLPLPLWTEEPGPPRGLVSDESGGGDGGGHAPGPAPVPGTLS